MDKQQSSGRLQYFPISFFATVMGLSGLTIAWEKAQSVYGLDLGIDYFLAGFTSLVFMILLGMYASKLIRHTPSVIGELKHPVKLSFFPAISISFLLLSIVFLSISEAVSFPLWVIGSSLHLIFTLYVINVWMHHEHFQVNHINPAWFIPAVGNVLVPVAGVAHGFIDVSWFFFSIGLLFWIILMSIFFNRILFHNPLDKHLLPTLFILIAPPAVGFIAYMRLNGELDSFARILYFAGLFLTLLLLSQAGRFVKLPFFLSWWAYSFPLAAITIASFVFFEQTSRPFYLYIASGLLALLTFVLAVLIVKTTIAIRKKGICQPEH
ncbi:MAG: C4-dicarboxylate transporter/malic acid transport protein [uncultured Thiotrichaceae bacterium]|uniref:C4-dicarboxylate transporter/malic acid transport protein n=1 Tax=uncultured Thiotrichaceae bacterium TaxID=298394 RepID=A0A6S6TQH7_9GAMM|nr:MAG: C4-dicarboxylate transporter/malic acid transport protein [uncultured Thiotrichaceae bacterium]